MADPMSERNKNGGTGAKVRSPSAHGVWRLLAAMVDSTLFYPCVFCWSRPGTLDSRASMGVAADPGCRRRHSCLSAFILNRIVVRAAAEKPQETQELIGAGLRALLDSTGPSVVAIDVNGQLIYCNPAVERLLGYHASELANLAVKAETEILGQERVRPIDCWQPR